MTGDVSAVLITVGAGAAGQIIVAAYAVGVFKSRVSAMEADIIRLRKQLNDLTQILSAFLLGVEPGVLADGVDAEEGNMLSAILRSRLKAQREHVK